MTENYLITVVIPVYNQEILINRALDSIPARSDVEVIVINDGSTDDTWNTLQNYKAKNRFANLVLLNNEENRGVSYTVNRGYDNAQGTYIVNLGSDDYFYTDEFISVIDTLKSRLYDLVYFNLKTNTGEIFRLTPESRELFCGSVKFMNKTFLGDSRCPEAQRSGEDWFLMQQLIVKNPREFYTDIVVKHYDFPREGSLCDQTNKGLL